MKKYFSLLVLTIICFCGQAQLKMTARSTYSFDGNSFYVRDTSTYFNNPANTIPVNQNFTDAFNYAIYDSSHYYYYNQVTQTLDLTQRTLVTFDPAFTHQLLATYHNYTNNVNDTRDDYTNFYTGNNLDSQFSTHSIIVPPSTIFYSKNYFHYNAGNYVDTAWYVTFQTGNYFKTNKYYYTYTAQNLIDETFAFESTDSINYTNKIKTKNYYNAYGDIDSTVSHFWQAGTWYKYTKKAFIYNASNMLLSAEVLSFNLATQLYSPVTRIQYTRTNGTLLDSSYHQAYNQTTLKYDTVNKYGFIHFNGLLMHEHSFTFNQVTNLWEPTSIVSVINYYYNMLPNTVSDQTVAEERLSLFPNPCESYLHINTNLKDAHFAIFSIDGRFMQSGTVNSSGKILVQSLPVGCYIIKTNLAGIIQSEQFSKQ